MHLARLGPQSQDVHTDMVTRLQPELGRRDPSLIFDFLSSFSWVGRRPWENEGDGLNPVLSKSMGSSRNQQNPRTGVVWKQSLDTALF